MKVMTNSVRATQLQQWCTFVLRHFPIRGYVLGHKRTENGAFLGVDYYTVSYLLTWCDFYT